MSRKSARTIVQKPAIGQGRCDHRNGCGRPRPRRSADQPRHQLRFSDRQRKLCPPNGSNRQAGRAGNAISSFTPEGDTCCGGSSKRPGKRSRRWKFPRMKSIKSAESGVFTSGSQREWHTRNRDFCFARRAVPQRERRSLDQIAAALAALAAGENPLLLTDEERPVNFSETGEIRDGSRRHLN